MSLEQQMMRDLQRFHALRSHNDTHFAAQLTELQRWQTDRLRNSHAALLADPLTHAAADFFIGDMYGGTNLTQMAQEVERALNLALKLLPEKVMYTAAVALEANAITLELDEQMVAHYLTEFGSDAWNGDVWYDCYRAVGQRAARERQLQLLHDLGMGLDKYVRSRIIQGTFKLVRGPATRAGFVTLYDFLDRGFAAMKPIQSAEHFVGAIVNPELAVCEQLFAGNNLFAENTGQRA